MLSLIKYNQLPLHLVKEYRDIFVKNSLPLHGGFFLEQYNDLEEWLKYESMVENGETDWTPCTTFFYFDDEKQVILGIISIRHNINYEPLAKYYGHIGYSVHPDYRRQGHAKSMLSKIIPFAKELGLEKILITCANDNVGSYKTIESNSGILESTIIAPNGQLYRRYWIEI